MTADPHLIDTSPRRRMLLLEDNVRDVGGHYLELASLLADGARALGYEPTLVTHREFASEVDPRDRTQADPRLHGLTVEPRFEVRRMENWSLGVDGRSNLSRTFHGQPLGTLTRRICQGAVDRWNRPGRGPYSMLRTWTRNATDAIRKFNPTRKDRIIINTGGDFQMLALARALEALRPLAPLSVDVLLHFAIHAGDIDHRAELYGQQIQASLASMTDHQVSLYATTTGLSSQLDTVGVKAKPVPYPTRLRRPLPQNGGPRPRQVILAGMQRAEKGRSEIKDLLTSIEHDLLRSGSLKWSMQIPSKLVRRVIPESMRDLAEPASPTAPLDIRIGNVSSESYHRWLDDADVGLFLYDPNRYLVRCSGVLLEMMVRGKPVIVPDGCWLAEQVRKFSDNGPIGWIYQSTQQVPNLLKRLESDYASIAINSKRNSCRVAQIHSGRNTLQAMEIPDGRIQIGQCAA